MSRSPRSVLAVALAKQRERAMTRAKVFFSIDYKVSFGAVVCARIKPVHSQRIDGMREKNDTLEDNKKVKKTIHKYTILKT